jgi:acyl-CoA reductase-like NAD-dependent aldehyde dehydrogenase
MEPPSTLELARIFALQHAASRAIPSVPWTVRADRLRRLRALLQDHRGALAAAISADFGQRSRHETELLEINPLLDGIAHSLKHGPAWMRPRRRPVSFKYQPGAASLMPQPLGVAGIVVPWNYPLALSIGPLNGALCAGNRVLVKLSELTPRFGDLMAALVAQHFGEDELRVFNGDAGFSKQFCLLPFDHLLFTGSTAVGHQVMRAASDSLTPVTLELGGKSPAIIGPSPMSDRQFDRLVRRLVIGKTFNAGQTCIAPDYAFVPRPRLAQFIDSATRAVAAFYPSLGSNGDYTSIINARHFDRLQGLVDDAVQRGATAWPLSRAAPDPQRRIFPPVLLSAVAPGSAVLEEEIFGPVLPVLAYDELDEVLAWVNARPRPLALYLFERNQEIVRHVLSHTVSGGVTVNDTFLHVAPESLPFGGVGASGMGAYHGEAGFRSFSHFKPVFTQGPLSFVGWLYPPFGKLAERILRMPGSR